MGHISPLRDFRDFFQGSTNEAITRCVNSQLIESASHQSRANNTWRSVVNTSMHEPFEDSIARATAETQATALPYFNRVGKNLGNQVWQIVRAVFQPDIADAASAEQV
jgi:hypothetical protein